MPRPDRLNLSLRISGAISNVLVLGRLFFILTVIPTLGIGLLAVNPAAASPLAHAKASGLSVRLDGAARGQYRLVIDSASPQSRPPEVLVVENPTRLVVDVPGVPSKSASSVAVRDGTVKAIRIGVHPDKTRIVLDIAGSALPEHRVVGTGVVEFSVAGAVEPLSEAAETPEPKATPTALPTALPKPSMEPTARPTSTPTPQPSPSPKPTARETATATPTKAPIVAPDEEDPLDLPPLIDETPKPDTSKEVEPTPPAGETEIDPDIPAVSHQPGTGAVIQTIYYQTMNNTKVPAVAFEIEGMDTYSLNKKKPDLYELVIQNARLGGKHLSLPQFPPDTFRGFSVIVPREEDGNVFVKIYVEENVKLFPFIAKGQLWLKVAQ